jgi:hypothetical protein
LISQFKLLPIVRSGVFPVVAMYPFYNVHHFL